ncbi:Acetyltransferase (GNAT) family protein [Pelagimonas phthalicica]|uniref:Acetyltransferase (GNAT) family protein n=1 Tax=Pelagimonas phthalicica TaxID=1037362 RepID=A0A238JGH4_9RHOB|nr:GNAT family N-acetyltransferase [Pelagimonas phthalicica]TDS92002.1 L-amino acid N-acyltransferase YncA [Pelagimonas phthalicica]SMX29052.1 Acetyltransferase (GNAT) family protein [Pelagimonas phthalicica]
MKLRQAVPADAPAISAFLQKLTKLGQRNLPDTPDYVATHYIGNANRVSCLIAMDAADQPVGIQIVSRAEEGNAYDVTPGWGIIGTHISPEAQGQGIGKALFAGTLSVAREYGLPSLDAAIGEDNSGGQAYYEKMGFKTYRTMPGRVCKRFDL